MLRCVINDEYSGLPLSSVSISVSVCHYCEKTGNQTIPFPGLFGRQDSECNQGMTSWMYLHVN